MVGFIFYEGVQDVIVDDFLLLLRIRNELRSVVARFSRLWRFFNNHFLLITWFVLYLTELFAQLLYINGNILLIYFNTLKAQLFGNIDNATLKYNENILLSYQQFNKAFSGCWFALLSSVALYPTSVFTSLQCRRGRTKANHFGSFSLLLLISAFQPSSILLFSL